MIYDLIIVGLGPAGVSAAIYAKRSGLNVIAFESNAPGGLLNTISKVDNYPGFMQGTGPELAVLMFEQLNKIELDYKIEKVVNIHDGDVKTVVTNNGEYKASKVIIATGRKSRNLGIKNEKKFEGKGLSYCALCDANLYKDKDVAVVGGGNSALEETLYLADIVNKVYLIHRSDSFRADTEYVQKIKEKENIEILYNSNVCELKGDDVLSSIVVNEDKEIEVSAIFTYIGYEPYADFIKELDIADGKGYIITDDRQETKVKGIFAAGDSVKKTIYQIVTATSEGAIAAISAKK